MLAEGGTRNNEHPELTGVCSRPGSDLSSCAGDEAQLLLDIQRRYRVPALPFKPRDVLSVCSCNVDALLLHGLILGSGVEETAGNKTKILLVCLLHTREGKRH